MVKKFDIRFEFAGSAESVVSGSALCGCFRSVHAERHDLRFSSARFATLERESAEPRALTSVRRDVADALNHGSERAIALKRLIRAAYERYALPHGEVGFTRDLYHSVRLAALHADLDITSDLATALVVARTHPSRRMETCFGELSRLPCVDESSSSCSERTARDRHVFVMHGLII